MQDLTRRHAIASGLAAAGLGFSGLARAQELAPTTVANAAGNVNITLQQMLRDLNIYEKYGLKPNLMAVADGSKIMGGLIGGDVDSSMMSGFGQIFPAIEKGAKLKMIGGCQMVPSLTLFTSKDDVRSLKDLEGKTIGTGAIGALLHQLCVAILAKNKVDVSKVRFVNIGASGDVFRAAIMGTIDAGTGETAVLEDMELFPKLRMVEGGNMTTGLAEYTYQGAWTSDRMIQTKRDVLVRSLAAHAELYRYLHTPAAKNDFLKARAKMLPTSTEKEGISQWEYIQHYKPYAVDLVLSDERLTYIQQLNVEAKVQSNIMPAERVADMTIARDALALVAKMKG